MRIFKKAVHSKIDAFAKILGKCHKSGKKEVKLKKIDSFYLVHRDHNVCNFIKIWVGAV